MRSREERAQERTRRAVRKAEKKKARLESFANRIAPQLIQMTPEERRRFVEDNPGLFRDSGSS